MEKLRVPDGNRAFKKFTMKMVNITIKMVNLSSIAVGDPDFFFVPRSCLFYRIELWVNYPSIAEQTMNKAK